MKIYGNSKSDGFPLLLCLVGGLFVAGGVGLAKAGAVALFVGVPVFGLLVAVMVMRLRTWDVMSELDAVEAEETAGRDAAHEQGKPGQGTQDEAAAGFFVAGSSDTSAVPAKASWAPSQVTAAGLPSPVEKPKSAVETNTAVA